MKVFCAKGIICRKIIEYKGIIKMQKIVNKGFLNVYMVLIMIIFPLFYTNNYINILQSKRIYFDIISMIFLPILCIFTMGRKIDAYDKYHKICLTFLTVSTVISVILSNNKFDSFFALSKRMFGAGFVLICVFLYVIISRTFRLEKWMLPLFLIMNVVMSILVILDNWKIDVLKMKSNLVMEEHYMFTGTLGNINVNAIYFSMILPLCAACVYLSKRYKGILISCLVIVTTACLCLRSDSIVISILITIFGLAIYNLIKKDSIYIVIKSYLGLFLGIFLIQLLYGIVGEKAYPMDSILTAFSKYIGPIVLLILLLIMMLSKHFNKEKEVAKIIISLLVLLIIGVLIWLILFSTDDFGTQRGYVWRRTLFVIKEEGFFRFLFGHGFNSFKEVFHSYYEVLDKPYLDAHNEILQMVMSVGLFGTIGYIGLFVVEIIQCIKDCKKEPVFLVPLMIFISYMFQGMVNNPHVFTFPIIFAFMAITSAIRREVTKDEEGN